MLALRVHELGGDLHVDEAPEPEAGPGEVVVDVAFASVNPLDIWVSQGDIGVAAQHLPWVPGTEATGHVDGRPVIVRGGGIGVTRPGVCAQRAAVPAEAALAVPDGVDLAQAAAVGVAGLTAWNALHDKARVAPGDRVLVLGASAGVGCAAVQLARAAGATVWAQTGSPAKAAGIVADRVVVTDGAGLVGALAGWAPTVVLDGLGGAFTAAAVDALAPAGRLVVYGTSTGEPVSYNLRTFYRKGLTQYGYAGLAESVARMHEVLGHLFEEMRAGRLRMPVELVPLARAHDAHRRILERRVEGKLVIDCRG